jgi:metallo-beta-lactamase class B
MVANDGAKQLDVLFFCSISVAYNRLVNPPQYPTIVADYESSFQKLKGYHVDVFLAPHPEMFDLQGKKQKMMTGAANPFMDSHEFEAFLARAETDFRRQLAEQQSRAERK